MKKLVIFNTLTRKKEEFIPLMEDQNYIGPRKDFVGIYSCGPTVYSMPHFGNLRQALVADMIKNVIKNFLGYNTVLVSNITDVGHIVGDADRGEDKMEKGSRIEGLTVWEIAKKYENIFIDYFKKLNIAPYDVMPRATEHLQEQLDMVLELEKKGYAYIIPGDGVYMDTSKVNDYGKLLGPNFEKHIEGLKAGARIDFDGKRNPTDFALWKFSPAHEKRQMEWDSPWGKSFPGWHIECSAMATKYLGKQFDIHHGGYDLIPVHHSNEIAQSECYCEECKPWVKYWMHHQFVNINGEKMSKSKGNSIEIQEVLDKGYSFMDLRYWLLSGQYRNFLDFTWSNIEAAKNTRLNLIKKLSRDYEKHESTLGSLDFGRIKNYEQLDNQVLQTQFGSEVFNKLIDCLFDDLNTPELISNLNKAFSEYKEENELVDLLYIVFYLDEKLLKLDLLKEVIFTANKKDLDIPEEIKLLADKRWFAKQNRNFSEADEIRQQILSLGYEVKDGKEGYEIIKI